jgi:hypothetical protein
MAPGLLQMRAESKTTTGNFNPYGGSLVKRIIVLLSLLCLAASTTLVAQSSDTPAPPAAKTTKPYKAAKKGGEVRLKPFSEIGLSGGISFMGVNLQAATNLNRYMNVRGVGNVFSYTISNFTTNGFSLNGTFNMASAGAAVDFYPFPKHGFRLSPGVMFYNQNQVSATAVTTPGTSFTLDNTKYYSDSVNPLNLAANLGLNANKQAFTMTTGWGNMIPRKGGHWSFPFELGAVFTGAPTLNMTLAGSACTSQGDANTNGPSCVNMATNATAQSNLASQVATYRNDVNLLQFYPILSFGVSYAIHLR